MNVMEKKENKGSNMKCEFHGIEMVAACPKCTEDRDQRQSVNRQFLIDCVDRIHDALCPRLSGTWQQRCEQAVVAAELLSNAKLNGTSEATNRNEKEQVDTIKGVGENICSIPAICAAWLVENGYDGLCDPDAGCRGCSVIDLMPCRSPGINTCVPAHKELQDDGDWLMFPGVGNQNIPNADKE
jgi:hypothetical protein